MIRFTTVLDTDGSIRKFEVSGHSGYGESGEDIVCAAVSSTVWMTINGIEKQNLASLSYEESDGFVTCTVNEKFSGSANALLNSLSMFIEELSKQYEDFLKFTQE